MTVKPNLILCSQSPARKRMLHCLGVAFITHPANIDERAHENEQPDHLALRLSQEKAEKYSNNYPGALLIGADQVVSCEGAIFGKPKTNERAIEMLSLFSDTEVDFINGLSVHNTQSKQTHSRIITVKVKFKQLSPELINSYLAKEEISQCAGAIRTEGLAACLIEQMNSPDIGALEGLPLANLYQLLSQEGLVII